MAADNSEIRYLTPIAIETKKEKYCRFKKLGITYIDYKDADFLLRFITEQGKILRTPTDDIRTIGRATQGVRLMDLDGGDKVVSVALVDKFEEPAKDEDAPKTDEARKDEEPPPPADEPDAQ